MNNLDLTFTTANEAGAGGIAALRNAAADSLTRRYGQGHWSSTLTERGVLRDLVAVFVKQVELPTAKRR